MAEEKEFDLKGDGPQTFVFVFPDNTLDEYWKALCPDGRTSGRAIKPLMEGEAFHEDTLYILYLHGLRPEAKKDAQPKSEEGAYPAVEKEVFREFLKDDWRQIPPWNRAVLQVINTPNIEPRPLSPLLDGLCIFFTAVPEKMGKGQLEYTKEFLARPVCFLPVWSFLQLRENSVQWAADRAVVLKNVRDAAADRHVFFLHRTDAERDEWPMLVKWDRDRPCLIYARRAEKPGRAEKQVDEDTRAWEEEAFELRVYEVTRQLSYRYMHYNGALRLSPAVSVQAKIGSEGTVDKKFFTELTGALRGVPSSTLSDDEAKRLTVLNEWRYFVDADI